MRGKTKQCKPWGRSRIPTAPAGSRHATAKDYCRHRLPKTVLEYLDDIKG